MGLFSASDIEKINKTAEKTVQSMKPVTTENVSKMSSEIREMEKQVQEYFADSQSILIESAEQLNKYVDDAIAADVVVGIDTETTGLDRVKDYVVGASLYFPGYVECYIPMKHVVPLFDQPYKGQLSYEDVGKALQKFVDAGTKMIFANADFDLAMIKKDLNVDMNDVCYFDVILAWRCLKENELHNDLKSLYNKYVLKGKGNPMKFRDFFTPKLFPYCKPQVAKLYAANDAKITVDLYLFELQYLTIGNPKCTRSHLEKIARLVWDVEFPLIKVCQNMHRNGIYLDKDVADALQRRYRKRLADQQADLARMIDELIADCDPSVAAKRPFASGKDLNVNSTTHMKYLVYQMMGVPQVGGKQGTGKDVLTDLNLPITNQVLAIRSTLVLINTFVEKLPKSTTSDSRIHAQFKQVGADTGRMCLAEGTQILTTDGLKNIENIVVGDCVRCYFYEYSRDLRKHGVETVTNTWKTGENKECVKITFAPLTCKVSDIICTPEHKILTFDRGYVQACDLVPGEYVVALGMNPETFSDVGCHVMVKNIEKAGFHDVYDIEVADVHNFIAEGVCVHNSSADPNMQNVPSHAKDIRHLFRATPATSKDLNCEESDEHIQVNLFAANLVYTKDKRKVYVEDLEVGSEVLLKCNGIEVYRKCISRSDPDDNNIVTLLFDKEI